MFMDLADLDRKKVLYVLVAAAILIGGSFAVAQNVVATTATGGFPIGNANCSVSLDMIAMKDGAVVNSPLMNNPLFLDGVEIDSIKFEITITATGQDVEWDTLAVTASLSVNGQHINSWDWTILDFSGVTGGYEVTASWTIDELDYLVGSVPDRVIDNIGYYDLDAILTCYGSIMDVKDNSLSDSASVINSWELSDASQATQDPLVVPEFTSNPADITVTYGNSFTLSWTPKDDNPLNYKITSYEKDSGSSTEETGYWISDQAITITMDALWASLDPNADSVSVSITCFVYDDDGQSAFDSVIVTINLPTSPDVDPITWDKPTAYPSGLVTPKTYEVMITWYPHAAFTPDKCVIYLNGQKIDERSWNGGSISYIDTLVVEAGKVYKFECKVWDTSGNSESNFVTITGEDSGLPTRGLDDEPDQFLNLPFEIPGVGEGGTVVILAILAAVPVIYLYRRWRED